LHNFGKAARAAAGRPVRKAAEGRIEVADDRGEAISTLKARLDKGWTVADSMCLNPVSWGVTMEKKMYYMSEIAKLQA
jgi:hypothetical protein